MQLVVHILCPADTDYMPGIELGPASPLFHHGMG